MFIVSDLKEKVRTKKAYYIVGIILVICVFIGISYALWTLSFNQKDTNMLASDCFQLTFTEDTEAISLDKAYPITDEEGKTLTPYTFTITNQCSSYASYQVNLEVLDSSTLSRYEAIKVELNEDTPVLLSSNEVVQTTLDNATTSFKLKTGYLDHNESVSYDLRLWMDENITMEDTDVMNTSFASKITITASYIDHMPSDYELCVEEYGEDSIQCSILADVDNAEGCPTVNADGTVQVTSSESTNGYLCSAPDDYGTSYYYRGNVENNWVKFGGYYWRILRINGDGSIRMIYAGDASVIDALPNKSDVLKNGYNDRDTDYTQIGTSRYNNYWKKDNIRESSSAYVNYDNAGVGYMYGNRDGITEGSIAHSTNTHKTTETKYYAQSYSYNEETDQFTLVDPVGVLGSDMSEEYVGWYTMNSTNASTSVNYVYKVTSVSVSTDAEVGYAYVRYGTTSMEKAQTNTNDSDIKAYLDNWYEEHLSGTEYESYIADTLFCNYRSLGSNTSSSYNQLGYGVEPTKYRWDSSSNGIRLTCSNQNDRFTVDDEVTGNGDLTYPIGLINTDEVYLAGGSEGYGISNSGYYLYTGNTYWTMSPYNFNGSGAIVRFVNSNGNADGNNYVYNSYGVRPVINLKVDSLKSGDGSASNPYSVESV